MKVESTRSPLTTKHKRRLRASHPDHTCQSGILDTIDDEKSIPANRLSFKKQLTSVYDISPDFDMTLWSLLDVEKYPSLLAPPQMYGKRAYLDDSQITAEYIYKSIRRTRYSIRRSNADVKKMKNGKRKYRRLHEENMYFTNSHDPDLEFLGEVGHQLVAALKTCKPKKPCRIVGCPHCSEKLHAAQTAYVCQYVAKTARTGGGLSFAITLSSQDWRACPHELANIFEEMNDAADVLRTQPKYSGLPINRIRGSMLCLDGKMDEAHLRSRECEDPSFTVDPKNPKFSLGEAAKVPWNWHWHGLFTYASNSLTASELEIELEERLKAAGFKNFTISARRVTTRCKRPHLKAKDGFYREFLYAEDIVGLAIYTQKMATLCDFDASIGSLAQRAVHNLRWRQCTGEYVMHRRPALEFVPSQFNELDEPTLRRRIEFLDRAIDGLYLAGTGAGIKNLQEARERWWVLLKQLRGHLQREAQREKRRRERRKDLNRLLKYRYSDAEERQKLRDRFEAKGQRSAAMPHIADKHAAATREFQALMEEGEELLFDLFRFVGESIVESDDHVGVLMSIHQNGIQEGFFKQMTGEYCSQKPEDRESPVSEADWGLEQGRAVIGLCGVFARITTIREEFYCRLEEAADLSGSMTPREAAKAGNTEVRALLDEAGEFYKILRSLDKYYPALVPEENPQHHIEEGDNLGLRWFHMLLELMSFF